MARIPITRTVNVTLTRQDNFPTRENFQVALLLTPDAGTSGLVDGGTKVYGSIQELSSFYAATTETYKAALAYFSQTPRPKQLKIGKRPATFATPPVIQTFLSTLENTDDNWYTLNTTSDLFDTPEMLQAAEWIEARNKMLFAGARSAGYKDKNNAAVVGPPAVPQVLGAAKKGLLDRTAIFWHPTDYLGMAASAYLATTDFDAPRSHYTLKFKSFRNVLPVNETSATIQAITGFVPSSGMNSAEGHRSNTYHDQAGINILVEGQTLKTFVDVIHGSDWIVARTAERLLGILANNRVVPYTNRGMNLLVSGIEEICGRAAIAGIIEPRYDETGTLRRPFDINVERVEAIPVEQRVNRIAPTISVVIRHSGAVHYVNTNILLTF